MYDTEQGAMPTSSLSTNTVAPGGSLMIVSRRVTHVASNQDVLRLYDRFRRTHSRWAERRLAALGVIPPPAGGKPQ